MSQIYKGAKILMINFDKGKWVKLINTSDSIAMKKGTNIHL